MSETERPESLSSCPPCHWIIADANGPTSMGRCKRCGEKREHKNSVTDPKNWHALDKKRQENDPEYFNRPGQNSQDDKRTTVYPPAEG